MTTEERKALSDVEVLERSQKDSELFAEIIERYQKRFMARALHIVRSKEEAQDIVQDTFVKIFSHGRSFKEQPHAHFSSWAYKILINTCFTYCKKRKREQLFVERADDEMMSMVSDTQSFAEKYLDIDEFLSKLSKIPVALARVLSLTILEGKTQEDIAVIEGISPGAVRTRLHRAKALFKKVSVAYETVHKSYGK